MKNNTFKTTWVSTLLCGAVTLGNSHATPVVELVTADITADTTWDSDTNNDGEIDKIYFLDKAIFVGDLTGATRPILTITPGTVIAATGSAGGNSGLDVGSLVVTRDGGIQADGTKDLPIIFTSAEEAELLYNVDIDGDSDVNDFKPDPIFDGGAWGGVIVLGNAPINYFDSPTNNLNENSIEGFVQNEAGTQILYGGNNTADDSGSLSYLSIRFGGFEFEANKEINGLTLGGVGSATSIHHIEVVGNTDDGFEFFGGTVNTSYLAAIYCQDESFDLDEGHQGVHQFWFALQSNESDHGTEADGGNKAGAGVKTGDPKTLAQVYNATYVGAVGDGTEGSGSNNAFRLKDNYAGQFHNSIFTEMGNNIIRIDDADTANRVGAELQFTNNIFGTPLVANVEANTEVAAGNAVLAQTGNQLNTNPVLTTMITNGFGEVSEIDPRPVLGSSPAWSGDLTAGAPESVSFKGAFGVNNWLLDWTYVAAELIVVDNFVTPTISIVTPADITTDTTWDSDTNNDGVVDRIYFIDKAVFVGDLSGASRPTLTIEAGTVIAGTGSDGGTNGLDVGSLIVTRDGRILADGEVNSPIVFTSVDEAEMLYGVDIDDDGSVNDVKPDPIFDGGAWGGVIVLGRAPINYFDSPTNNINENAIEGFAQNASGAQILYGGTDGADNSGSLSYISIRFGGYEFEANKEINGLTLGGVGSGTSVHHIEVVGNTDDGVEFFGGTVNTSYLAAIYCQDESFDLDEGHQGVHQFWFALQSSLSDHGTEADGGNRTGAGVKTGDPKTTAIVYNATYVGAVGDGSVGTGSNNAFRFKDNYAGQFHNSIFTEIGASIIQIDDADTAARVGNELQLTYNIFGTPVGDNVLVGSEEAAGAAVLAQAGNQLDTDPVLSLMTKNEDGEVVVIDPRPLGASSPAFGGMLLGTAPTMAPHAGAFGEGLWTQTWTYSSQNGIVISSQLGLVAPAPTFVGVVEVEEIELTSRVLTGATFSLSFVPEAGSTYSLAQSSSLTSDSWGPVPGVTLTDGTFSFPAPTGTSKIFYRIEKD